MGSVKVGGHPLDNAVDTSGGTAGSALARPLECVWQPLAGIGDDDLKTSLPKLGGAESSGGERNCRLTGNEATTRILPDGCTVWCTPELALLRLQGESCSACASTGADLTTSESERCKLRGRLEGWTAGCRPDGRIAIGSVRCCADKVCGPDATTAIGLVRCVK